MALLERSRAMPVLSYVSAGPASREATRSRSLVDVPVYEEDYSQLMNVLVGFRFRL